MLRSIDTHPGHLDAPLEAVAPELKDHEAPEQMAVVVRAALVLAHQLLHIARLEEAVRGETVRTEDIVHEAVPLVGEPMLHRHAEALLAALEDGLGELPRERALQKPLALAAAHLEIRGNAEREVHYFIVEVRDARLERARHA